MHKARASAVLAAVMLALLVGLAAPIVYRFPKELRLLPGQEYTLRTGPLFTVAEVAAGQNSILSHAGGFPVLRGTSLGEYSLQLRILGLVPVRAATVRVVPEMRIVPGGQSVGILLSASGLLVLKTIAVEGADGKTHYPARDAGLRAGDLILRLADRELMYPYQIEEEATRYGMRGTALPMVIERDGQIQRLDVRPVLGRETGGAGMRYLLGIYVRDPAAGVGTLTFWDEETRRYGALGHMVTNDDRHAVIVNDGRIVQAHIHSIQAGVKGRPGEKLGLFEDGAQALGTIDSNTRFGIFGTLFRSPDQDTPPVTVAMMHEVMPGPAEILTVLDGEKVERFGIEILDVSRQFRANGKGLVIKVTDPRLIRRTNGIVQGMSGSPILQNNRLVGAVTHVYVNDPTRGFGILAEWMVYEAGILSHKGESAALVPLAS